jgi:hypothetical protein
MNVVPRCADLTLKLHPNSGRPGFQNEFYYEKLEECEEMITGETEYEIDAPSVSGTTVEVVFTYSCIRDYQPDPPEVRTYEWATTLGSKKDGYPNL